MGTGVRFAQCELVQQGTQPGLHTGGRKTAGGNTSLCLLGCGEKESCCQAQGGSRGGSYLLVEGDGLTEVAQ